MNTPPTTALLVVYAQTGVLVTVWQTERIAANLAVLVAQARRAGAPVIWVQHADDGLTHGSEAWQLAAGLQPAARSLTLFPPPSARC